MNDHHDTERWRLLELCERSLDGKLTDEEAAKLEQTLREDAELRGLFAQSLQQHAELRFDSRLTKELAEEQVIPFPSTQKNLVSRGIAMMISAATAALGTFAALWMFPHGSAKTLATVTKSQQCKWSGSSLPTAEGSRVGIGTLELAEGLATLRFDSGAEVVMEAPATIEIVSAMACRLKRGTLVAEVPPSAKGFTVDTQEAKVVDYGTRFGVSTGEDGKYMVQVLEGLVEVNHQELRGGQRVDKGGTQSRLNPPSQEHEPNRWQPNTIMDAGDGWQVISTAFGKGKDSYIQSNDKAKNFGRDPFLRVKNSSLQADLNRKGYLCFDISKFKGQNITDAELVLSIEPSDLGFATLVPDSTFAVYGLTDESEDEWDENNLTWQSAPAHDPQQTERHLPVASKTALLGHFLIKQGVNRGSLSLHLEGLRDFLAHDTNGLITLILCRETDETSRGGFVHAFASKESGNNTPPLLRVKLGN